MTNSNRCNWVIKLKDENIKVSITSGIKREADLISQSVTVLHCSSHPIRISSQPIRISFHPIRISSHISVLVFYRWHIISMLSLPFYLPMFKHILIAPFAFLRSQNNVCLYYHLIYTIIMLQLSHSWPYCLTHTMKGNNGKDQRQSRHFLWFCL